MAGDFLLASSVNGGGVFLVDGDSVERLSKIDTTGVAAIPGGFILARQAEGVAELRRLQDGRAQRVRLVEQSLDLHDVLWHDGRLYVVSTQLNTLFELDAGTYVELRSWCLPGEPDSQHVNSVCLHEGRILASRFGRFATHRGYKGNTRGAGEVFDVETGEVVIGGLSQPHSLTSFDGRLWLCDSQAHVVRVYRGLVAEAEYAFDGYVRGLAFDAANMYVGLSRSRNDEASAVASATVVTVARAGMRTIARVSLPVDEIYDLRLVAGADRTRLLHAALDDANAEFDTQVHLQNLQAARAQAEVLQASVQGAQQLAALEARAARDLGEACSRLEEEQAWSRMLAQERLRMLDCIAAHERVILAQSQALRDVVGSLEERRQAADALETALASRDAELESLHAFIRTVTGSRSWRWTRPLRRLDPVVPAAGGVSADAEDRSATAPEAATGVHARSLRDAGAQAGPVSDLRGGGQAGGLPAFVAFDAAAGPRRSMLPIIGLEFAGHAEPLVSIVVVTTGDYAGTLACMRAIQAAGDLSPYEVILVDDGSGEDEIGRFAHVPGLQCLVNQVPVGVAAAVAQGAALARGAYIHVLGQEARVRSGWLDALVETFALFHECGVAGATLVERDGRLVESGRILWNDGRMVGHGRGDDSALDRYATVREVDAVSREALMLRGSLLRELGGFGPLAPAALGDADLALRARSAGHRVYVQAASRVVLPGCAGDGNDTGDAATTAGAVDRTRFVERWQDVLQREQLEAGEHPFLARERAQRGKIVLVIDRHPPQPDRDAGSRAIWQLMRVLFVHGFRVKFWAVQSGGDPGYADNLRRHGIELLCSASDGPFDDWIAAHGRYLDGVVLSRPLVAQDAMAAVRRHAACSVIYYGHDIHALRIERQGLVEGRPRLVAEGARLRAIEEAIWRESDLVLYPSNEETSHVRAWLDLHGKAVRAETIPLFAYESVPALDRAAPGQPGGREELLFVGGFGHVPNADGALWFAREAWPRLRERWPALRLRLVGADPTAELLALAGDGIMVPGHVDEAELMACYARARVVVAPLRFGAGTKGKVLEAMLYGVPCVVTPTGAQGLGDAGFLRVCDDVDAMVAAIDALLADDEAWWQASRDGQEYVRRRYSVATVWSVLSAALDPTPYPDVQARRDALAARDAPAPHA